jgi:hypothetical protein
VAQTVPKPADWHQILRFLGYAKLFN